VVVSVTEPSHAVFLSYASQDAEAAQRICDALRAAGVEVWLDKSDLRGGDAWDRSIRQQIHDCALFVPIISQHTHERLEGYFRREWKLAVDRTHDMAEIKAFLVPVVIDSTTEQDPAIPEKFRELHWTRLPGGETTPAFVERIKRLLSSELSPLSAVPSTAPVMREPVRASWRSKPVLLAIAALVAAVGYLFADRFWISKHETSALVAFAPPPHSVAVLAFANLSGDKEQEYFSDGLTEELLDSLAEIDELQVAARTSAFSFKGKDTDLGTIARKLNVGTILEGSVRRSGNTVRISAQLINAVTGFYLWSKSYDRDLGDVLNLQTEIATAVAQALKITLLGDISEKIELGGTHTAAAFDAYLRASKAFQSRRNLVKDLPVAIAAYTEAIELDPNYALALAGRSYALTLHAGGLATGAVIHGEYEKAESDARRALALAPELAEAHMALASFLEQGAIDFARASEEFQRAVALAPGNAQTLRSSSRFAAYMGHSEAALSGARRALMLDPLDLRSYGNLGAVLHAARRFREAAAAYAEVINLNPDLRSTYDLRGLAFYALGDLQSARASCETKREFWGSQRCLAVVYDKLGRHADAEVELKKFQAAQRDDYAYQYASVYAQWGDHAKALDWLDTAMRLRDPGLVGLKSEVLFDPLRQEPRFQAVLRELKFPD
jgi:TolB-like protein